MLQIPNQVNMLLVLQSFVVESAKVYQLPNELLERLKLVSEEAFLHILKTSFSPNEQSFVKVSTDIDDLQFFLSFFDTGLPYDSSLTKEYQPETDISQLSTEGMELFLIKQFVDTVEWINHGSKGKELRLSINIPQKDILSIIEKQEKEEKKTKDQALDIQDLEIRLFHENDAIKISRTIYRAYGYSYPNEDMYYPAKITGLNKNGQLLSVVCYHKKENEIVGHYALERPAMGAIAESGQAVVAPDYRGFQLMNNMRLILEKEAEKLQLEGIFSQPVTTHIFSQKVNAGFGSFPCGFSFGLVPQKLNFLQIDTSLSQRESCMLYFKPLKHRARTLFLPDQHKSILRKIYTHIGFQFQKGKTSISPGNIHGKVHSNYYANWGFGVIQVHQLGENNFIDIKQALYKLLFTMKADVIFLNIPLEDNDITILTKKLEKEKFFFCGVIPSFLNGKDVIRFEYLNGSIDAAKINIYGEQAKEIFSYILNEKEKVLR